MNIGENLNAVKARIAEAAATCGRNAEEIKLIAVTKTYPIELMNEAIRLGVTDIGENKPQEVRDKFEYVLPVRWHLIGHLQSNKVKYVIDRCSMIHSVDSIKLMDEIERLAALHNRDIDILIQVNISGEESKSGIDPQDLEGLLLHAAELKHTHVKGLMTIAPKAEFGDVSIHFENMQKLYNEIKGRNYTNVSMEELSMGMSGDFETAIKYGATMVRVGSAIFGARNYNN
ncbi:MAG: YggS family pyridoxal phosphate-dependent enzyme [Oscillospiraceae bacterium]|nr:YggS family pyridoxal phosphate-dependent enzyme [Oscillospiraceae bacterium]